MDHSRIRNAQQQSHELIERYHKLDNRIASFIDLQEALGELHGQLKGVTAELQAVQADVAKLQQRLPNVARKEELEQLNKRIDAIPFEHLVTRNNLE